MKLGDLFELLGDVGLGKLEVGLVGGKELRARVGVERVVGHGGETCLDGARARRGVLAGERIRDSFLVCGVKL